MLKNLIDSKRVISYGCSMTAGDGLAGYYDFPQVCSSLSYAGVIASTHDKPYVCNAHSGNGNDAIVRNITDDIRRNEISSEDFVIIGWTSISRKEFYNNVTGDYQSIFIGAIPTMRDRWNGSKASMAAKQSVNDLISAYSTIIGYSDTEILINEWHNQISLICSLLHQHRIPFMMNSSLFDEETFEMNIDEMYPHYSFHAWCMMNNYTMLKCGHPSASAHHEWAQVLLDWMKP